MKLSFLATSRLVLLVPVEQPDNVLASLLRYSISQYPRALVSAIPPTSRISSPHAYVAIVLLLEPLERARHSQLDSDLENLLASR